jgi:chromate reductase, NAD(P)H dehydrogenase (quinone)
MARDGRRPIRCLVFGASLRQGSLNDRLAALAADIVAQQGATADRATMADFECPSYDFDVEQSSGLPEPARELCRRIKEADAFIIASPEYNASMPGVLKNAIDWGSRARPQPFNGKQALLMSASPSMAGGNRGLWSLRVPLEHLGTRIYPDMFSLAQAHQAFGDDGRIANDVLQQRFVSTIDCFLDLVEAQRHYPALKKQWVEFLGERPDASIDRVESSPAEAA